MRSRHINLFITKRSARARKAYSQSRTNEMTLNQIFEVNPHLLHADVSAIVARNTFGVSDTQRLNTIADRALGRPDTR
ncbi:MAG: hypothetical protein WBF90_08015 [Rivularia sp. (in: cyanobacteria)]